MEIKKIKLDLNISDEMLGKIFIWGLISLAVATVLCLFNNSPIVLVASSISKFFAIVVGTLFGIAGALIGDFIRVYTKPDVVMTNGGLGNILWSKIFWSIGPQVIGLLIGVCLGTVLVLM